MRSWVVFCLWFYAAPLSAQSTTLDAALSVPDGATCLTRAALAEHARTWLGRNAVDAGRTILVELGQQERLGVAFVLLDGETVQARRRFERLPEACPDRRAARSLALAIALDASVLDRLGAPPAPRPPQRRPPRRPLNSAAHRLKGTPTHPEGRPRIDFGSSGASSAG